PSTAPHASARSGLPHQLCILIALAVLVAVGEFFRWRDPEQRTTALTAWLCGRSADWLPFAPWLLAAPIVWRIHSRKQVSGFKQDRKVGWLTAAVWAGVSFTVSAWTGSQFGDLPPAYHD